MVLSGMVGGFGESLRDGAPPMMPPSRNLMEGVVVWNKWAMERAVRGDIAFRSR